MRTLQDAWTTETSNATGTLMAVGFVSTNREAKDISQCLGGCRLLLDTLGTAWRHISSRTPHLVFRKAKRGTVVRE
jgi:hypothetical protein